MTTYERHAISLLILVIAGASAVRYYQHRSLERRLEIIAAKQPPTAQAEAAIPDLALTAPINVNTASAHDLQRLPGVGPVLADRIIEFRKKNGPFKSLQDLDKVSGIGPHLLEKAGAWILVQ